jgi:hypothetical protein
LLIESDAKETDENEAKQVQRRADHCDLEGEEAGMPTAKVCRCGRESPATVCFSDDFWKNAEAFGSFRKGLW